MTLLSISLAIAKSPFLTSIAILASTYFIWIMIVAAVLGSIRWNSIQVIVNAIVAMIAAWLLQQVIGLIWFQPRPFVSNPGWPNLISKSIASKSFPSDHAAIAFALATAITLWMPSAGKWFYLGAIVVAIGRIAVGVHRPIDVVVGAFIGTTVTLLIQWIRLRL